MNDVDRVQVAQALNHKVHDCRHLRQSGPVGAVERKNTGDGVTHNGGDSVERDMNEDIGEGEKHRETERARRREGESILHFR